MRPIALATLTVAFFASAEARFGLGSCPGKDLKKMIFTEYTPNVAFPHYIKGIDSGLLNAIEFAEHLGFKPQLNVQCGQLGEIEPWKALAGKQKTADAAKTSGQNPTAFNGVNFVYDSDLFNKIFNSRDDAILSMVHANPTADLQQEVYYFCADSLSLPAIFEFTKAFGLESDEGVADQITSIASIFTKLGLNFKLDGGIVTGWAANKAARDIGRFLRDFDLGIPGYSINEIVGLSKSPKLCSSFTGASTYNDDALLKTLDDQLKQLWTEVGTRPTGETVTLWSSVGTRPSGETLSVWSSVGARPAGLTDPVWTYSKTTKDSHDALKLDVGTKPTGETLSVWGSLGKRPTDETIDLWTSVGKRPAGLTDPVWTYSKGTKDSHEALKLDVGTKPSGETIDIWTSLGKRPTGETLNVWSSVGARPAGLTDPVWTYSKATKDSHDTLKTDVGTKPSGETLSVWQSIGKRPTAETLTVWDSLGQRPVGYSTTLWTETKSIDDDLTTVQTAFGTRPVGETNTVWQSLGTRPAGETLDLWTSVGKRPAGNTKDIWTDLTD